MRAALAASHYPRTVVEPARSDDARESSSDAPATPPPLRAAAALVGLEGVALLVVAALEVVEAIPGRRGGGLSLAVFFSLYAVLLLGASVALLRRQPWARGPVLASQLVALGLAWNARDQLLLAVPLALAAILAVAAILQPASIAALERIDLDER